MSIRQFPEKDVSLSFDDLAGGLNTTSSPLSLQNNEASDLQNVDFDVFGSVKKRNGYAKLNSSAFNSGATCTGLHWFEQSSGTDELVSTFGNKIAKMDSLDGTWDDITGGLTITAGNTNMFSFTTFLNTTIGTNNVDVPFKYTGTGTAAALTVPSGLTAAKWTTDWNNYAFLANTTVSATLHASRFYWSDLKDIGTWGAASFIDVSRDDGQTITGFKPLGDRLVVFKDTSIHIVLFTGDADIPFIVVKTPSDVGCISGYSIQEVKNGLVFLAKDGLYFFDGSDSTKVSGRINNTFDGFAKGRYNVSVSAYQRTKGRYWLSQTSSGGSTNNRVVVWDTNRNAFSIYYGDDDNSKPYAVNALAIVDTSGEERIYFGDYAGFAYRADNGTSDNPAGVATAINFVWKSKWFSFEDLTLKKGVTHLVLYYQISSTTISVGYSYDLEDGTQFSRSISLDTSADVYGTALYGTATYASSGGFMKRIDTTGRGRVMRIIFTNNVVDEEVQIDGFGLFANLETVA